MSGHDETMEIRVHLAGQRFRQRQGYEVIDEGWKPEGEAEGFDFVIRDREDIAFVRLTFQPEADGQRFEHKWDRTPLKAIEHLAMAYFAEHPEACDCPYRFDAVSIAQVGADRLSICHHKGAYPIEAASDGAAVAQALEELKARFHDELKAISYDLGGSLVDMVEDCLAAAIKSTLVERGL